MRRYGPGVPKIVATEENSYREGLQAFSHGGVKAIRVEALARRLGCAKSSFYWHFKTKAQFVDRMLVYWSSLGTHDVIARLDALPDAPARFRTLLHTAFGDRQAADFLFHLRHLARGERCGAAGANGGRTHPLHRTAAR